MKRFNQDTFEDQEEPLDLDDPLSILLAVEHVQHRLNPSILKELMKMPKKSPVSLESLSALAEPSVLTTDPRITQLTEARDAADVKINELKAKLADVSHNRRIAEEAMNKAKAKLELINTPANSEAVDKLATIYVEERATETKLEADIAGLQTAKREAIIQLNRLVIEEQAEACKLVLPDEISPMMQLRVFSSIAQMCQFRFASIQYNESMARAYEVVRHGASFPEFERNEKENRDEASIRRDAELQEIGIVRRAAELAYLAVDEDLPDTDKSAAFKPTLYWKSDRTVLREQYDRKSKQALERADAVRALAGKQREGTELQYQHLSSDLAGRV